MDDKYAQSPLLDITLPPPVILPYTQLILLYTSVIGIDLVLLRNDKRLPLSPIQLRLALACIHAILPLIFVSPNRPLNVLYAAVPWFVVSYSAHMPTDQLTPIAWIDTLIKIMVEPNDNHTNRIRCRGAATSCLGILKWSFMHLFIDPLLPHRTLFALYYPWLHPMSLIYVILYGVKAYCLLGIVDIFMGLEQVVTGWNMVQLFNSPILATSPRDFWSRRWNRAVRNLLHKQVFLPEKHTPVKRQELQRKSSSRKNSMDEEQEVFVVVERTHRKHDHKSKHIDKHASNELKSFFSSRYGRGLLVFIISGAFHEVIIMSTCRKLTLENFAFFTIQGIAVSLEAALRQGKLKQEPEGKTRAMCIASQLCFMALTGRLFLGPFLRYEFLD
ncbi:hypothetical protein RMCBS344292_08125 [Rhizopus microsporus]|nr:hypothetical protein RMCBS344292_08125 [Rhizopus microsporus]